MFFRTGKNPLKHEKYRKTTQIFPENFRLTFVMSKYRYSLYLQQEINTNASFCIYFLTPDETSCLSDMKLFNLLSKSMSLSSGSLYFRVMFVPKYLMSSHWVSNLSNFFLYLLRTYSLALGLYATKENTLNCRNEKNEFNIKCAKMNLWRQFIPWRISFSTNSQRNWRIFSQFEI